MLSTLAVENLTVGLLKLLEQLTELRCVWSIVWKQVVCPWRSLSACSKVPGVH